MASPGALRRIPWAVLLAAQCCASSAAAEKVTPSRSAAELRGRAQRLFQAHKFSLACPVFEAAAVLAPRDPALFADLALCQHRLGDDDLARQSNWRAIELASEESAIEGDPKMARLRRSVYFNLAALTPEVFFAEDAQPTTLPPGCGTMAREPGCEQTFFECEYKESGGGSAALYSATHVRIARVLDDALFEDYPPFDDFTDIDAPVPAAPIAIRDGGPLQYVESYDMEARTYSCDWLCERSEAVARETAKCRVSPKTAPADRDGCAERVCARAERTPWAAVRAELATSDECYRESKMFNQHEDCTLAYTNACSGLIGLVCNGESDRDKRPRTRVVEYRLEPADPRQ